LMGRRLKKVMCNWHRHAWGELGHVHGVWGPQIHFAKVPIIASV
jgi:hypothetical protein